jgi:hypothetical protein
MRKPPLDKVQGPGVMQVGMNLELTHVVLEFSNPDWWVHLTIAEARGLATLLMRKANELEADQRAASGN